MVRLGYLFWSVAYAAVGALVSRVEDLQAAVAPVSWTLVLSRPDRPVAANLPDAWYMLLASLLPDHGPVRDAGPDRRQRRRAWQIVLAAAIMLAATFWLVRLAGAVYSGALLRTGGAAARSAIVWDAARARSSRRPAILPRP